MKEEMSMNQEILHVTLNKNGETDVLVFEFNNEDHPDGISVNLNSEESGQSELKSVFSYLLQLMTMKKIKLEFHVAEGYSTLLLKEVSEEYVKALNNEITNLYSTYPKYLGNNTGFENM